MTRAQILAAGVTRRTLDGLVADGWLHRVHVGVYVVGHPGLDRETTWLAATLATEGVLSHRSAAELWQLLPPRRGPVHVTRARQGKRRPGVVVHEGALAREELTLRLGVRCTSLVRTLIDLAGQVSRAELARAFDQAQVLHHLRPAALAAVLVLHPGRRGTAALKALLADAVDPGEIDSIFELRFLKFCRRYALPRPRTQAEFGIYHADFLFEDFGVVVETDSRRWHSTAARRARDARKTAYLVRRGLILLRVSWHELRDHPDGVHARILAAFEQSNRT